VPACCVAFGQQCCKGEYALVSVALHLMSRSRRCSRSIPRRRDLGTMMVILLLLH